MTTNVADICPGTDPVLTVLGDSQTFQAFMQPPQPPLQTTLPDISKSNINGVEDTTAARTHPSPTQQWIHASREQSDNEKNTGEGGGGTRDRGEDGQY